MATVKELIDLFKSLSQKASVQAYDHDIIPLLNSARIQAWQIMTSFDRDTNYFLKSTSVNFSSSSRELALPADFGRYKELEVTSPESKRYITFHEADMNRDDFHHFRKFSESTDNAGVFGFIIYGPENAPKLLLDRYPPDSLEADLWYYHRPTAWTQTTSNIDEFPEEVRPALADWAAARYTLGARKAEFSQYQENWRQEMIRIIEDSDRAQSGNRITMGYNEGIQ